MPLLPLTEAQRASFHWIRQKPVQKVLAALEAAAPGGNRFVGGCVRDSLLGVTPKDIDLATVLKPEETMAALKKAGLHVAPTGIDHGTVTAIADHTPIEATTLRADVSTDGRRATVAYTKEWATDAARRDFTINALYLTPSLEIYDCLRGLDDLSSRRVRFIGDAETRIREDYLRILRFFRFSARFVKDGFDETGLTACRALADGVKTLSAERIGQEFGQLLSLAAPGEALRAMANCGVLAPIWSPSPQIDAAVHVKEIAPDTGPPVMLAALWPSKGEGLGKALRLSNAQDGRRRDALTAEASLRDDHGRLALRRLIHELGDEPCRDGLLLAAGRNKISKSDRKAALTQIDHDPPPSFPIQGRDVLAAGAKAGREVGDVLKAVEQRWIAEDFPDKDRVLEIMRETLAR